jgi:hypothetical protein
MVVRHMLYASVSHTTRCDLLMEHRHRKADDDDFSEVEALAENNYESTSNHSSNL